MNSNVNKQKKNYRNSSPPSPVFAPPLSITSFHQMAASLFRCTLRLLLLLHVHFSNAQRSRPTPLFMQISSNTAPASCNENIDCTVISNTTGTKYPSGSCIKGKCSCIAPWSGPRCRKCNCKNEGKCGYSPWNEQYDCDCTSDFTGPLCKQCTNGYQPTHDECEPGCPTYPHCNPPYGTCIAVGVSWWCNCFPPFGGNNCTDCQCINGGTCKTTGQTAQCSCPMGEKMGRYCQCLTDTIGVACSGHGTCYLDPKSSKDSGCICNKGWDDKRNCSKASCFENCTSIGGHCDEPWVCTASSSTPSSGSTLPPDALIIAGSVGGVLVGMVLVLGLVVWLRGDELEDDGRGREGGGRNGGGSYQPLGSSEFLEDGSSHGGNSSGFGSRSSGGFLGGGIDSGGMNGGDSLGSRNGNLHLTQSVDRSSPRISTVNQQWIISRNDLQVGEMFAAGTSSHVFKGMYNGELVALKKIPVGLLLKSDVRKAEFQREAQILSSIIHPNIVHFHGLAETNLHVLIVTEYCPHSLGSIMQLNPWPAHLPKWSALCVSIGAEIAGGMHFLHQQEIMHRDLKPENILLDSNYHPKICDFGVARLMKEGSHQFTMTGQIGTPIYMAPEIIVGNRNRYGRGADVYSFGILMWSMWHRDIPYKQLILSEGLDAFQLAQRVTGGLRPTDAVTDIKQTRADGQMPTRVERLMIECWAHAPDTRPSFEDVARRMV